MSAFCEPVMSTSIPQRSMGTSYTPTAVMPSTTSSASRSRVIAAICSTGCTAVVEVSLRLHEHATRLRVLVERLRHLVGAARRGPIRRGSRSALQPEGRWRA